MDAEQERTAAYAESTARSLVLRGTVSGRASALSTERDLAVLRRKAAALASDENGGAWQWLRDNLYLAEREGLAAAGALRHAGRLRCTEEGAPLISAAAEALLQQGGGRADEDRCRAFLTGLQRKTVLSRAELSLFPAALRMAAIKALRRLYASPEPQEKHAAALFGTLRLWSTTDPQKLLESVDRTEQTLLEDPSGVYPTMSEESRAAYRTETERLARRWGIPEYRAAQRALRLAQSAAAEEERHVGYWLFERPLGEVKRKRSAAGYIALNVLLTLFFSLLGGFLTQSAAAALLLLLPVSELVKGLADTIVLRFTPPRPMLRMELKNGVGRDGRTICVLSALICSEEDVAAAAKRLEECRLLSRDCGDGLLLGLLMDLPEADTQETEADRKLTDAAKQAISSLNRRCGGGFYLFTRPRQFSADSGRYTPPERKRGAVLALAALVCRGGGELRVEAGDAERLRGTRFILTLDSDTRLTPGAARALVGAMLHPLNRPVVDAGRGVVVRGHGVIQPRIATSLRSSGETDFARIFAPQGGLEPYSGSVGEVYSNLFGSGGFAGKGIFDAEVLLRLTERALPPNRILSHDALEGALLRGGLMTEVQLIDGFPATPVGYFKREHRWVRGDWQNTPWLFRRGRVLPPIERWRLFDSLRRSLLPPAILASMLCAFFFPMPGTVLAAAVGLITVFSRLLLSAVQTALRPEEEVRLRVLSPVLHGAARSLTEALLQLLLLPHRAWVNLSAAVTALWRLLVTKRNLLQWQTAAQSDSGSGLPRVLRSMTVSMLTAALCLLSPSIAGKAAGSVWLLAPFILCAAGERHPSREALSPEDRNYLLQRAGEIWRYFAEFCTEEEHYLPPDNFQESPGVGLAHRTSPTNIGLSLMAALSALDLGIASRRDTIGLIERQLSVLETLPEWHGHLYNWYDTRSLRPLQPAYISTVDSGNLAACLIAAEQGLLEYGCPVLAGRAGALRRRMDFTPLYDESRGLFRIGLCPAEETQTESWYDLLESEERLTAYLCIASAQVPVKHWQRLSRAQVACDGFRGCASWSGTMFEYLMPELFLPLCRDSLLAESARFALYVQKKERCGAPGVWGRSESAFASLDSTLSYRYKAHGCAELALSRSAGGEQVIAPYASFLALAVCPGDAIRNLRRLEKCAPVGRWGFWEAVDFTPSRADREGRVVRCVMAHHLGMSITAIANALSGGAVRRRFMADAEMGAYTSLLEEKLPLGGLLLHRRDFRVPTVPRPAGERTEKRFGEAIDWFRPAVQPLSNGLYRLLVTESGILIPRCSGAAPYRTRSAPPAGGGEALWLETEAGERIPLLPVPGEAGFRWELDADRAQLFRETEQLESSAGFTLPRSEPGERRLIRLRSKTALRGAVVMLFEPSLLPERESAAQPAFSALGLSIRREGEAVLFTRLPRNDSPGRVMVLRASRPFALSCDGERYPGRSGELPFTENTGWQSAPLTALRFAVSMEAGEEWELCLSLAVSATEQGASTSAERILAGKDSSEALRDAAGRLGLDAAEVSGALDTLPELLWPGLGAAAADQSGDRREALWRFGISGDVPIVLCETDESAAHDRSAQELRRHALLEELGIPYDLVFPCREDGDYRRSRRAACEELLRRMGREERLGTRGGIHFVDAAQGLETLQSAAVRSAGETPQTRSTVQPILPASPLLHPAVLPQPPESAWTEDAGFSFSLRGALPQRAWQHLLCNEEFGALCTECGTGFLWYRNARECPIIPWSGDVYAVSGPETLCAEIRGRRVSFFAEAGDADCRIRYSFGAARWEKTVDGVTLTVTAWVDPASAVRCWELTGSEPVTVYWCAPLQLAPERGDAAFCRVQTADKNGFTAWNPRCTVPGLRVEARCSVPFEKTATDRMSFLAGGDEAPLRTAHPCFAASFRLEGTVRLRLGVSPLPQGGTVTAAEAHWRRRVTGITAETGCAALDHLLAGWCAYQAFTGRIFGRCSLYQSGGAVGFRDQLQDRVNLLLLDAPGCRSHILCCCAHQYSEGDVMHWWHPGGERDKGVRTRCSDDLLWLVWALCEYTDATGDTTLCRERVPFLHSDPLGPEEQTRYEAPGQAPQDGSVLQHCRAALELVLRRGSGRHGLLKMLGGDWNDGLDGLGEGAESAWLTWFFALCARRFAALLDALGEPDAAWYRTAASAAADAAQKTWSGDRYLRGYFGDGTPLGAASCTECRIDSLCQSFAALWPDTPAERANTALDTALRELTDDEHGLVRLLTPPFTLKSRSPGYLRSYGPGFRENGGQYTHSALFLAHALFARDRAEDAWRVLRCCLAETHDASLYGAEPYLVPADIIANEACAGRAGWTGYTGSAGWLFRVAFGDLLGVRLRRGSLTAECPQLPAELRGCTVRQTAADGKQTLLSSSEEKAEQILPESD